MIYFLLGFMCGGLVGLFLGGALILARRADELAEARYDLELKKMREVNK